MKNVRLVDADAYADELKRREKLCFYQIDNADVNATVSEVEYWSGVIGTFNEAMCVLADATTVSGWVSVKDRMPEDGQDVLAYLNNGEETRIAPCNYFNGVWFDSVMNCVVVLQNVTHWMPLPEPPEVSEND